MNIYIALFLALTAQRHFTGLIITTSHTMVANGDGVVFAIERCEMSACCSTNRKCCGLLGNSALLSTDITHVNRVHRFTQIEIIWGCLSHR